MHSRDSVVDSIRSRSVNLSTDASSRSPAYASKTSMKTKFSSSTLSSSPTQMGKMSQGYSSLDTMRDLTANYMPGNYVICNVYDIDVKNFTGNENGFAFRIPGAFHAGIEVYHAEWSFGYCPENSGIFSCKPKDNPDFTFRESIKLGITRKSKKQVHDLVYKMSRDWQGNSYEVIKRNCCTFSSEFSTMLGVAKIPSWVDRAARLGCAVSDTIEASADIAIKGVKVLGCMKSLMRINAKASYLNKTSNDRHLDIDGLYAKTLEKRAQKAGSGSMRRAQTAG